MIRVAQIFRFSVVAMAFCFGPAVEVYAADPPKKEEPAADASSAAAVGGETVCEVDVYYSWKRTPPKPPAVPDTKDGKDAAPKAVDPAAEDLATAPVEEFFTRVGQTALRESDARDHLSTRIAAVEVQARRQCEQLHQDESQCIARRLRSARDDYQLLDYASRKALLTSIERDCTSSKGLCLTTRVSAITCFAQTTPAGGAKATEAGAESAKDDKKKGKK